MARAMLFVFASILGAFPARGPQDIKPLPPIASPTGAPVVRALVNRDGLFYVNGRINGRQIRLLVDTGATITILTSSDARRLEAPIERTTRHMLTASGVQRMRISHIRSLRIGTSDLHDLDAAVLSSAPISILGQNALVRLGSLHIVGDELVIG